MSESIVLFIALMIQVIAIWRKHKTGITLIYENEQVRMYVTWLAVQWFGFGIFVHYLLIELIDWILGG